MGSGEALGCSRARALVMFSFVPVREVEQDEHALRQEMQELRGRLEQLEQVGGGTCGQAYWAGCAPFPNTLRLLSL